MKRSEMETVIEQVILDHQGYKVTDCIVAKNILTAIEKAGMSPPEWYAQRYEKYPNDEKYYQAGQMPYRIWESEDE